MNVLFFIEGSSGMLGLEPFVAAVETGLCHGTDFVARFVPSPPVNRMAHLADHVKGLSQVDADFQQTRWHVMMSLHTRSAVLAELEREEADVVGCLSHSVGLMLPRAVKPRPVVLMADAAMWAWRQMESYRRLRPWSRAVMAGSFGLEKRALSAAALVIAWTEWTRCGLVKRAPGADVIVLHPGLDLTRYRPSEARSVRSRPRVMFVGSRFAQKGGDDLIEALDPLLGRDVDLDLVTPHQIPRRDGVRHFVLGSGKELEELFRQADVLVLPTHGDAVPWVVLEAMASGTPVIATAVGAIPELLDGGATGVLVPPRRPDALRRAVVELLEDDARRAEIAQRGRAKCEENYDAVVQTGLLVERLRRLASR